MHAHHLKHFANMSHIAANHPQRALILGLGATGQSMIDYLRARGYAVQAADSRRSVPGLAQLRNRYNDIELFEGPFDITLLDKINLLAISPGVSVNEPIVREARSNGIDVVGDIELFARELNEYQLREHERRPNASDDNRAAVRLRQLKHDQNDTQVLAVTGSNGKSTVTALTAAMLTAAKKDTVIGGNIGTPVLTLPTTDRPDVYVLELSSFQLETVASLNMAGAALLNVTEDHLDRHHTLAEYARTKARIFDNASRAVINRDDPDLAALLPEGKPAISFGGDLPPHETDFGLAQLDAPVDVPGANCPPGKIQPGPGSDAKRMQRTWIMRGTTPLLPTDNLRLAGAHNVNNVMAALALASLVTSDWQSLAAAARSFRGLPHRMQVVAQSAAQNVSQEAGQDIESNPSVRWINDSKGTNVAATCAALTGLMSGPDAVLIAGGQGKGQDFRPLAKIALATTHSIILFGEDAPLIEAALNEAATTCRHSVAVVVVDDLGAAIDAAMASARPGDCVLFSPACASFDMFDNFEARGDAFIRLVHQRIGTRARGAQTVVAQTAHGDDA